MDHRFSVEWVPISRLHENPANPRRNEAAVPHVAASLRLFGWQQPVVARPSGEVIAGNTRLRAARELDMSEIPVAWFEGPDIEATAFGIADNRTAEFAEWDEAGLAALLQDLKAEDALEGVGYTGEELDSILAQIEGGMPGELDDPGPQEPAGARRSACVAAWRPLAPRRPPAALRRLDGRRGRAVAYGGGEGPPRRHRSALPLRLP